MKIFKTFLMSFLLFLLVLIFPACGHKDVAPENVVTQVETSPEESSNREPSSEIMASTYDSNGSSAGRSKNRRGYTKKRAAKSSRKKYPGSRSGGGKSAPIWSSFYKNFKSCEPSCEPANWGTYGERANCTCHSQGMAIDVGALSCGGKLFPAIKQGRFNTFVACMKKKMKTLYHNGKGVTKGHWDHAHFSNGCNTRCGRWY